jgi:hypothetical protein
MEGEDDGLTHLATISDGKALGTTSSAFVGSTYGYENIQKHLRPFKRKYVPGSTSGSTNRNCPVTSAAAQVGRAYDEFYESRGISPHVLDPIVSSDMSNFRGHFDLTSALLYFGNKKSTIEQMLDYRYLPGTPTRYTLNRPYRDTFDDGQPISVEILMSNSNDLGSVAAARKGIRIKGIFRQGAPLIDYSQHGRILSEEQQGFVITFNPNDALDAVTAKMESLDMAYKTKFNDEERNDLLTSFKKMFQMYDTFTPNGLNVGYTIGGLTYTATGYFERGESTTVTDDASDGLRKGGEAADMVFRASVLTINRRTLYAGTRDLIAWENHARKWINGGDSMSFSGETAAIVSLIRFFMGQARRDSTTDVRFLEPLGGEGPRSVSHIIGRIQDKKRYGTLVFQDIMSAVCLYTVLHFVIEGLPPDFLGTEVINRQVIFFEIFNALGRKADLLWYGDDRTEHSPELTIMLDSISAGAYRLKSYKVTAHN